MSELKFNKYKHKKSTKITQGVLTSLRHRDKLYKQLKLTYPDSSEYEMLLNNLKKSYFETHFNQCKYIYKILGNSK